ncbi:MAG: hypothetical protein IPN17_11565 [Deltaproteobacteria bacterium]|nr:hypothetical protein [Deltaproteobacteria bacterium]
MKSQNKLWWLVPALFAAACSDNVNTTPVDTDVPIVKDTGEATDLGSDSGTPTDDTGGAVDSGTPTEDTGTPTGDTGKPVDSGTPADDTGGAVDSGTPADDTGGAVDSGTPADDTGGAVDSGTPADDAGTPADDTGPRPDVPTCTAGQSFCGTGCVDTNTDNTNCGTCGTVCAAGQSCQVGLCRRSCSAGQSLCGDVCSTLDSDPANCGSCGAACPAGQMCSAGRCALTCAAPRTVCTSAAGVMNCVDTLTDAANCGACGNACSTGQSCVAGACRLVCPAGQTQCGDACVDTQTSTANCGACGTACATGQSCAAGVCRRNCGAGETLCGDACVNTQTSGTNCGACGRTCPSGQSCAVGACVCPMGQTLCGAACIDTQTSVANCGACGRTCTAGQTCTAGACVTGAPANDLPAGAVVISLATPASTIMGTTTSATSQAGCGGADVYYRFTLARREVVYVDTFGTAYDTELAFAPASGTGTIAGTCTDDSCGGTQSQIARVLDAGTYYVVVSGFSTNSGPFTLHFQHLPIGSGAVTQITSLAAGTQTFMGTTSGTGVLTQSCTTAGGPETSYWFMTCPTFAATQFNAATCGAATWDTVLEQRSAARTANICNDDGCGAQSTITGTLASGAGLHSLYVDGYSAAAAGAYTLSLTFGTCPTGQNFCGTSCVSLQTSATNCGACGTVCAAPVGGTTACVAGACVRSCPAGQLNCGGTCRAVATDASNCGACGTVCAAPVGGTTACVAGACVPSCPAGLTNCGGTCRNLATDSANCGACGAACVAPTTCSARVCRATNETCATPAAYSVGGTVMSNTATAQNNHTSTCGNGGSGRDVAYSVVFDGSPRTYTFTSNTTGFDGVLHVHNAAACTTSDEVACNDDDGSTSRSTVRLVNPPAGTYLIVQDAYATNGGGAFTLTSSSVALNNDTCASPAAITRNGRYIGTTAGRAANSSGSCNTNTAPDVVYAITATRSGTITVDTSGSAYDTVLYVGNTCGGSTLGCNDDTAGLGLQSRVAFAATAGTTYYVVVDGYSSNSGAYVLNVSGL